MIPRYRACDSSSYRRMYQPDEVMVGNGDIWIIDEDSCDNEWIINNDLHLMQSTGLRDKNDMEIFEGDVVTDGDVTSDIKYHQTLGFYMVGKYGFSVPFGQGVDVEYFEEFANHVSKTFEVVGNIYENPKLLEVTE